LFDQSCRTGRGILGFCPVGQETFCQVDAGKGRLGRLLVAHKVSWLR
jgi:hypothetical protein